MYVDYGEDEEAPGAEGAPTHSSTADSSSGGSAPIADSSSPPAGAEPTPISGGSTAGTSASGGGGVKTATFQDTPTQPVVAVNEVHTESSSIARYFESRTAPCPRINPAVVIRGHTLYVYGGVTELGDAEVTLDDCWSLDLNKRDQWRMVAVYCAVSV